MSYKMRAMPMELDRKRKHNVHRGLHTSGKSNPEPDWLKVKLDVFWCNYFFKLVSLCKNLSSTEKRNGRLSLLT